MYNNCAKESHCGDLYLFLHKQKIQAHKKIQAIVCFNIFVYLCRRLYSMSYEQGSHYGYSSDCLS